MWKSGPAGTVPTCRRRGRGVRRDGAAGAEPLTAVSRREDNRHLGFLPSVHVCSFLIKEIK